MDIVRFLLNKVFLGKKYELLALGHLQKKGYTLICKNYRFARKEIDLIFVRESELIFVEVKFRSFHPNFGLSGCVDVQKQQNIRTCAEGFCEENQKFAEKYCRFDVVLIGKGPRGKQTVEHIEHAFE